jgi:hypothetical protein
MSEKIEVNQESIRRIDIECCKVLCGPYAVALGHRLICPIQRRIQRDAELEAIKRTLHTLDHTME